MPAAPSLTWRMLPKKRVRPAPGLAKANFIQLEGRRCLLNDQQRQNQALWPRLIALATVGAAEGLLPYLLSSTRLLPASMQPAAGVDYPLQLGASLLGKRSAQAAGAEEYCTLRYDFKPASAGRAVQGQMEVQLASQKVRRWRAGTAAAPPVAGPLHCLLQLPRTQTPGLSRLPCVLPLPACRWRSRWATLPSLESTSPARMAWTASPCLMAPPFDWSCWELRSRA